MLHHFACLLLILSLSLGSAQSVRAQGNEEAVASLLQQANALVEGQPDSALSLSLEAIRLADNLSSPLLSKAYFMAGTAAKNGGSYKEAFQFFHRAIELSKSRKDTSELVNNYRNLANTFQLRGDYDSALFYHFEGLVLSETTHDLKGQSSTLNGIGNVFESMGDYNKALKYYKGSVELAKQYQDENILSAGLNNIGVIHERMGNYQQALDYYLTSLQYDLEKRDSIAIGIGYNNIGAAYLRLKDFSEALRYQQNALVIQQKINDQYGIAYTCRELAKIYLVTAQVREADRILDRSIEVARKIEAAPELRESLELKIEIQQKLKQWDAMVKTVEEFYTLRDSLVNKERENEIRKLELLRKETENESLKKKNELQQATLEVQKATLEKQYAIIALSILALFSAIGISWIFYSSRQKIARLNALLVSRNQETTRQKEEISNQAQDLQQQSEEINTINEQLIKQKNAQVKTLKELSHKNLILTDSLRAAQRVQLSIFPELETLGHYFSGYFLLNRPKDLVSGDFFWIKELNEKELILAVGDCTGHGVTGSLMTIVGITQLEQIVMKEGLTAPHTILDRLHQHIRKVLRSEETGALEGMDMLIMKITSEKGRIFRCQMASAKRPLLVYGNKAWTEWKGDRKSIGGFINRDRSFQLYEFELLQGNRLYLFSDGIIDQHNAENQKFGLGKLKKTLEDSAENSMELQKEQLLNALNTHQGEMSQRDDMLVLGVEL